MRKIDYNKDKVLRSCILTNELQKIGFIEEEDFILSYFLKNNVFDTQLLDYVEESQQTMFEESNYIDNLSSELVEVFEVGVPLFNDIVAMLEVLNNFYDAKELKLLTFIGVHKLFATVPTLQLLELIDLNKATQQLKRVTKTRLLNMSVEEFNKFIKKYLSYYLNYTVTEDIVFKFNDSYYLNYDIVNTPTEYFKVEIEEVKEYIIDFVDNMDNIEDFELIYEYML